MSERNKVSFGKVPFCGFVQTETGINTSVGCLCPSTVSATLVLQTLAGVPVLDRWGTGRDPESKE